MTSNPPKMQLEALQADRATRRLSDLALAPGELCTRYEALTTAIVNDVLREKSLLYQTLPNTIRPLRDEMRVAGLAFTIKGTKSLEIQDEMEERAEMLEAIPEWSVVAWDTSGDDESAQWGEVMTMASAKRGCRGAVIDGGTRDTDKILEQGFPVFARYRTSNGMLGRFRIIGYDIPIRIGGVHIRPGDLIFGDMDGVIVVPRDLAYEVLLRGEEIRDNESEIKRWVREGMSARDVVKRGGYF